MQSNQWDSVYWCECVTDNLCISRLLTPIREETVRATSWFRILISPLPYNTIISYSEIIVRSTRCIKCKKCLTKHLLYMGKSWHEVWKNVNEVWQDEDIIFLSVTSFAMDIIVKNWTWIPRTIVQQRINANRNGSRYRAHLICPWVIKYTILRCNFLSKVFIELYIIPWA